MPRFNIWKDYWEPMKLKSPKRYEQERAKIQSRLAKKRENIREAKRESERIERAQQTPEFFAMRERQQRLRDTEWTNQLATSKRITGFSYEDINKMTNEQLRANIQAANEAIRIREEDFLLNYRYASGDADAQFDFHRNSFELKSDARQAEMRDILRKQQKYLSRQNTWEEWDNRLSDFIDRTLKKAEIQVSELSGTQSFRKRFFDLYNKALEQFHGGTKESKGSPIYAVVADLMRKNAFADEKDMLDYVKRWYERDQQKQREEESRAGVPTTAALLGLTEDDDLI